MTVREMLFDLQRRGYNVDAVLVAITERPDIGKSEVIKAKYRRKAGTATRYRDGTFIIRLASRLWLTPGNAWDAIHETFLHELAHCFTKNIVSHGAYWQSWCKLFGIEPDKYHPYTHLRRKKPFVVAVCVDCTHEYLGRKRLNHRTAYYCKFCGGIEKF